MRTPHVYVFDNGPQRLRVVQRAVVRHFAACGVRVAIGVPSGDEWVFGDLAGANVELVVSPLPASARGTIVDLARWCPRGAAAIDLSLDRYPDTRSPNWKSLALVAARGVRAAGLPDALEPDATVVPMADLPQVALPWTPERPSVWLDLDRCRDPQVHFVFDVERLLAVLPEHDFVCSAPVRLAHGRLRDVSAWSLLQRATMSTKCDLLVGSSWSSFALTLHEANRWKPKIVCGYDPFTYAPLWDYSGSPLEHVATMAQLADFLRSQAAALQTARA
ncbi:MAG: hypothetical protein JNK78_12445 [Planctomycetes bacterium]|nr:hypothetical protein [Planctomycetota bacterium]